MSLSYIQLGDNNETRFLIIHTVFNDLHVVNKQAETITKQYWNCTKQ